MEGVTSKYRAAPNSALAEMLRENGELDVQLECGPTYEPAPDVPAEVGPPLQIEPPPWSEHYVPEPEGEPPSSLDRYPAKPQPRPMKAPSLDKVLAMLEEDRHA
jgi:hypothetical protein